MNATLPRSVLGTLSICACAILGLHACTLLEEPTSSVHEPDKATKTPAELVRLVCQHMLAANCDNLRDFSQQQCEDTINKEYNSHPNCRADGNRWLSCVQENPDFKCVDESGKTWTVSLTETCNDSLDLYTRCLVSDSSSGSGSSGGSVMSDEEKLNEALHEYCEYWMSPHCDDTRDWTVESCVQEMLGVPKTKECAAEYAQYFTCMCYQLYPGCRDDGNGHSVTYSPDMEWDCPHARSVLESCLN